MGITKIRLNGQDYTLGADFNDYSEMFIPKSQLNQPGGVAGLGQDGKIPVTQLPSTGISADSATKATQDGNGNNIVNTYLSKTDAGNTYLSKTDAGNTYLSKTDASNTYLSKTDASGYLSASVASSTYLSKTDAESTYVKGTDSRLSDARTPTAHNQAASTITAGTLAGQVLANATSVQTLGTAQVRNINASTADLTAGTSNLATGDIYLVYE